MLSRGELEELPEAVVVGHWEGDGDAESVGAPLLEADAESDELSLDDALAVGAGVPEGESELLGESLDEREARALLLGEGVVVVLSDALPDPLGEEEGKGEWLATGDCEGAAV